MKKGQQEIIEKAPSGLEVIEITYGSNGYPSRLGDVALLGFETFEEAKKFSNDNNLSVHLFSKRDGHQLWSKHEVINRPLSCTDYVEDLGDNYSETGSEQIEQIKEDLKEFSYGFEGDFSGLEKYIKEKKELLEEIDNAEEDEVVIVHDGQYFETVKRTMMSYHEDVTQYAIGVFVPRDTESSEEED